ncbi:MAG: biotin--[acetyl-CoA-carboxylase] ligase [Treponema sp.]|jgi:BirA family biotin operon repressor/biotin-[acetyl-CoA-carboxylase] ligase|nr:biotin--[acetyl-CoA-carboxylase] ligase [Treponema sp.]
MNHLPIHNPFNAPVYHEDTVDSTMNVSRLLAQRGEPHGTVIVADFQEAGRGRVKGRAWEMEKGSNLACTVLLRFPGIEQIPPALTLRAGLAVSLAIEDFAPALAGTVRIKWPNDIMLLVPGAAKVAGILAEADGGTVHIGMGINVAQKRFPDFLSGKATSMSLALGRELAGGERFALLEKLLARLHDEIAAEGVSWRSRIEERMYKKGELVCFMEGPADSGKMVSGLLAGIGPGGELSLAVSGGLRSFTTGELRVY